MLNLFRKLIDKKPFKPKYRVKAWYDTKELRQDGWVREKFGEWKPSYGWFYQQEMNYFPPKPQC